MIVKERVLIMILFMIKKTGVHTPDMDISDDEKTIYNVYSDTSDTPITEPIKDNEICLLSWNEVFYKPSHLSTAAKVEIKSLDALKAVVESVAQSDSVCKDMVKQFKNRYGIDLFPPSGTPLSPIAKEIKDNVYLYYAHPCIANLNLSPHNRPMTMSDQYTKNWNDFPYKYMTNATKASIKSIFDNLSNFGLKEIDKSSRDQVKLCRDFTYLSRAIFGEMTTYVTKKLEKIFALRLCLSPKLSAHLTAFIHEYLFTPFKTIKDPTVCKVVWECVKDKFLVNGSMTWNDTEYLCHYIPPAAVGFNLTLDEGVNTPFWFLYINLLKDFISATELATLKGTLSISPENDAKITTVRNNLWIKLPLAVRAAMLINSFRRLNREVNGAWEKGRGIESKDQIDENSNYYVECKPSPIFPDFTKDVVTMFKPDGSRMCPWNFNRPENNDTVKTYRHYLMPLWGGSSGHTRGHIEAARNVLGKYTFTPPSPVLGKSEISFVPCLTSALFLFWRLYYDKRISGVHTLTETFEAALSLHAKKKILQNVNVAITNKITFAEITSTVEDANIEALTTDIYDLLIEQWSYNIETDGIPISVHILNRMHIDFWNKDVTKVDAEINRLREEIAKKFEVPQWSVQIKDTTSKALQKTMRLNAAFSGIVLRTFANTNVQVYKKPTTNLLYSLIAEPPVVSSDRLKLLHGKLSAKSPTDSYNFCDDFKNLPSCLCGGISVPFLSEIDFTNIKTSDITGDHFTFTADYSLKETPFIKLLKTITSVELKGSVNSTVFDNADGFYFSGFIASSGKFKITDSLAIDINGFALESCFEGESHLPTAIFSAELKSDSTALAFAVGFSFADCLLSFSVKSDSGVITVEKIFSLFGFDFPFIIPPEVNIGVENLSLNVFADTLAVPDLSMSFTAEKPLSVWGEKITFTPYAEIIITSPFDKDKRIVNYTLSGSFDIEQSTININYFSDNTAMIALDENSPLKMSEILKYFNIKANIPLDISDFSADLYFGDEFSMNLYLTVSEVLKITAGKAEFSIDEISLYTALYAGKLEDLKLSGQFNIAGFTLDVKGEIDGDKNYSISAFCLAPVNLIDFAERIADAVKQPFDKESIPEKFRSIVLSNFTVSYNSGDKIFSAAVDLNFGTGEAPALTDSFSINEIAFSITAKAGENAEFSFIAGVTICKIAVDLNIVRKEGNFTIEGNADFTGIKIAEIAADIGIDTDDLPDFITDFAIDKLSLSYSVTTKAWAITLETQSGTVKLQKEINGTEILWTFDFKTPTSLSADLLSLPLLGETVRKIAPETKNLSISDFEIKYKTTDGLLFLCNAFGEARTIVLYKKEDKKGIQNAAVPAAVHWFKIEKNFSVLTIEKVAVGLDCSKAVFLVDASLAVSPLTFSLSGAGFGVGMSLPLDLNFYLSGFGISFNNGAIAIAGSFSHTEEAEKESYSGALTIKYNTIAIDAIGEYSSGSFFAYAALLAPIGGPPAFFVTGLSLGFGYNKALALPTIEKVNDFPLITAVTSGFSPDILTKLKTYITDSPKENFITAGVKFNSFKMVNGFLLLTVSFGKEFEMGLLGTAEATVPPNCGETNPIARVVLEIKADLRPADGVFSLEAMLASDSYILSKDCKLTGGFAAYFWFANNPHSGDFAITLGGYHPAYVRPAHYPVVPRLGLLWNVSSNITISGEIYFALTPSAVMAGGKLSAVYQSGNLRAWFTAYADFLLCWKPFRYDISIGVSLGASYRIDWWFIHHTFSIELGADLHIWGPEAMGTVHISWSVISFTVSFGDSSKCHQENALSWEDFKASFLVDSAQNSVDSEILTISIDGIITKASDGADIADPKTLSFTGVSKIPASGNVRPSGGKEISAEAVVIIKNSDGTDVTAAFIKTDEKKNLPAAMWKADSGNPLTEEAVIKDAVCGQNLYVNTPSVTLFPKTLVISLDELYKDNTLKFYHCFSFKKVSDRKLSNESSLDIFKDNEQKISSARAKFLKDNGITETVSMAILAENADDYFAEEFLIEE
jgi:hypothetical protein